MILRDSISIQARPDAIFGVFEEMELYYRQWHPDHVLFRWVSGRGVRKGHVFYFEEYIAGTRLKKTVVLTHVVPNRHIEFAPTFWLMRLFCPGWSSGSSLTRMAVDSPRKFISVWDRWPGAFNGANSRPSATTCALKA